MAFSKKQRAEYNVYRDRTAAELGITKNDYNRLRRTAQAIHRADEDSAMGRKDWRWNNDSRRSAQYSEKEYKKDTGQAFAKSRALHKKANLRFYHQSDPRGASLYVSKGKKLNQENYNREGRHIY